MEQQKYDVYALLDAENRILALDGGVSDSNVDKNTWLKIDEGTDVKKYGGCQQNYVEMPLRTMDNIPRYKYVDGECVLRSNAEMLAEYVPIQKYRRITELKRELASYDYIGVKIATGVATREEYAQQIAYCEGLRVQIRALGG